MEGPRQRPQPFPTHYGFAARNGNKRRREGKGENLLLQDCFRERGIKKNCFQLFVDLHRHPGALSKVLAKYFLAKSTMPGKIMPAVRAIPFSTALSIDTHICTKKQITIMKSWLYFFKRIPSLLGEFRLPPS